MKKLFKKLAKDSSPTIQRSASSGQFARKDLERKVEEGTKKAIKEYRETFRILAEYDRS